MKNEGEDTFVKVAVFFIAKEKKRPGKKKTNKFPWSTSLLILKMQQLHGDDHLALPELMAGRGTHKKGWRHFCERWEKLLEKEKKITKRLKIHQKMPQKRGAYPSENHNSVDRVPGMNVRRSG